MPIILSEMLKEAGTSVQFDYLHFDGTAPILASMARGEVEGSVEVISTFGDAEENGEVSFLYDFIAKAIANEAELARQFAPIVESATAD